MDTRVRFEGRIPRPESVVFNAIVNEKHLTKYFATRATGNLEAGRSVIWYFDDVGAQVSVLVLEMEKNKRILFQWAASGSKADVEIILEEKGGETQVRISESNWPLDKKGVNQALGQMSGWTDFFDCLKAYLLFDVDLRRGIALERGGGGMLEKLQDAQDYLPEVENEDKKDSSGNPTSNTTKSLSFAIGGITLGVALGAGGMYLVQPNMCVDQNALTFQSPPTMAPLTPAVATSSPSPRPTSLPALQGEAVTPAALPVVPASAATPGSATPSESTP